MNSTDWERVTALFAAALEQPSKNRTAFLAAECGGDDVLCETVLALLEADEHSHSLLDGVATDVVQIVDVTLLVNDRIGPYRILRQLGVGGMGAVYLAERVDGDFVQTVALKLMRSDVQSAELSERFRAERQLLARLEHPSIARLLDGGVTADGRHYFTMEYVDGVTIDEYCARNRLSVDERLDLFVQILRAVVYAQQSLVVHRDIKPKNILVTDDGTVKLLDFGIAKVLADDALSTRTVTIAMTPQYAAPEQIRGEPVTTATDVYCLGLVLYELLCGSRPYDVPNCSPVELDEIICRKAPPPPSAAISADEDSIVEQYGLTAGRLRKELAGDLDTICLMALRKEPSRRYASAQQFLDDIKRYRTGRPVRARPDTFGYLSQKFIRRNRRPLLAGLLALLTIAGMLGFYTSRLAEERDRAKREAEKAAVVSEFMISLFQNADPTYTRGEKLTVRELVDRGAARVQTELAGEPEVRGHILDVIGTVYFNLGRFPEADKTWTEALTIRRALYTRHPDLATSLYNLGRVKRERTEYVAAEALIREGLAMQEALFGADAVQLTDGLVALSHVTYDRGDIDGTEELARDAIVIARRGDWDLVLEPLARLALALHTRHDYEGAAAAYREAIRLLREHSGEDDPRLPGHLHDLGQVLMDQNQLDEAEEKARDALARVRKLYGEGEHRDEADFLAGLGRILLEGYRLDDADKVFQQALSLQRQFLGDRHWVVAFLMNDIARTRYQKAQYESAEKLCLQAKEIKVDLFGEDHFRVLYELYYIGQIRYAVGDYEGAIAYQRRALAGLLAHWGEGHPWVSRTYRELALALAASGSLDEALTLQEHAVEGQRKRWGEAHRDHLAEVIVLADLLRQKGDLEKAEQLARKAVEGQSKNYPENHPELARALNVLATILSERGRQREAKTDFRRAITIFRGSELSSHPDLARSLVGLGRLELAGGDPRAAEALLREGLTILEAKLPATHPRVDAAKKALSDCRAAARP